LALRPFFVLDLEGYSFGIGLGLVFSGHRLRSGLRTDSTDFMTGSFLLSISFFISLFFTTLSTLYGRPVKTFISP